MFVVQLKFSTNKALAGEWMSAHKAWLQKGFDEGIFIASGSLKGQQGGCVLAHGLSRTDLDQRLIEDPLVANDVVRPEVIEFIVSKTASRLSALMEPFA
tara:strand:- start:24 stop:320 length:297 start_codon:yes stop_codon:yes gene_type:complete